jgi:tetratricopeptide (TPR) repeat protein
MLWGTPLPDQVARPTVLRPLLERAVAANPDNGLLREKLAYLHLDRFDFAAAAASFEAALALEPKPDHARLPLARCYNMMGRPGEALHLLEAVATPVYERGLALMLLGDLVSAEREFRGILALDADHRDACRKLCRLLRRSGREGEIAELCEALAERGARNAQLLYNWGWGLALTGDSIRARRLLFEPERVFRTEFPVPEGFAGTAEFNDALAEEILTNPHRLVDFPEEEEANRGSKRVDNLFTGRRPELIELLMRSVERIVAALAPTVRDGFDPWPGARPAAARLRPWGLLQRGDDYEAQHIHSGGWLSGVYYVRVPRCVSEGMDGRGCIEFGPPRRLAEAVPDAAPTCQFVPQEGLLLLSPSHYPHRTIPSLVQEDRITIAFDVVPDKP